MSSLDTRAVDRESLFLMTELAFEGRPQVVKARVRNLSISGMMVEGELNASAGEKVKADLRNIGQVGGTVAWSSAPRFGIAFDREIDPKLARVDVSGGHQSAPGYTRAALAPRRAASADGRERPA